MEIDFRWTFYGEIFCILHMDVNFLSKISGFYKKKFTITNFICMKIILSCFNHSKRSLNTHKEVGGVKKAIIKISFSISDSDFLYPYKALCGGL